MAKTIVLTGANRGIGLELARSYAAAGWQLQACCRNPAQATELLALAAAHPERVRIHPLDVTDPQSIAALAAALKECSIDLLFHNAGISGPKPQGFGLIDRQAWLQTFEVNTLAPFYLTQSLVELVSASQLRIVAIMGTELGSIADNHSGGLYAYRSSKAAVHMVMKSLAIDLASREILVVALHPGWVRTALGGPAAPLRPDQAAKGLFKVLERLTAADSGKLLSYTGEELPW